MKKMSKRQKDFKELEKPTSKKDLKVKITTYIDSDVYLRLNELAKKQKTKYQTLLNSFLRQSVLKEEDELEMIKQRLVAIEKKLHKAA